MRLGGQSLGEYAALVAADVRQILRERDGSVLSLGVMTLDQHMRQALYADRMPAQIGAAYLVARFGSPDGVVDGRHPTLGDAALGDEGACDVRVDRDLRVHRADHRR